MLGVQRRIGPDGQPHAVYRERIRLANAGEVMVKRAARHHVVLGMDFKEADVWLGGQNFLKMFRFQAHTGPGRQRQGRYTWRWRQRVKVV